MNGRDAAFVTALKAGVRGEVRPDAPLARLTTYRLGGAATVFLPSGPEDLSAGLRLATDAGVPVFLLGLGSNVLLPDEGMEALVIRLGKGLDTIRRDDDRWWFGAGLPAPLAARRTAEQGMAGLHMMVGVPGTVGGGIFMNAGCHGGQWSDVTTRVTVLDLHGADRVLSASEIPFTYRQSGLAGMVVTEAEVRLRPGDPDELSAEVQKLFAWRQSGTPFNQPCCGSVFKNPDGTPPAGWEGAWTAGRLLESAGLKGTMTGGVQVSPMHANYFVNTGSGTAGDVRALIARARDLVHARFGVTLETEVKLIGPRGELRHA
jgi:UDP-N-acetylmuramate dehydrogenase